MTSKLQEKKKRKNIVFECLFIKYDSLLKNQQQLMLKSLSAEPLI